MTRRLTAGLGLLAMLLAACATDPAGLDRATDEPTNGPSLINSNLPPELQPLATLIEAQLTCLYDAGLTPNRRSTLGKFDDIQRKIVSGDIEGAQAGTINLIAFIINKYDDYVRGGGDPTVDSGCTTEVVFGDVTYKLGEWSYEELKNGLIDALYPDDPTKNAPGVQGNLLSLVGLDDLCFLADGTYCETTQEQGGFVFFPSQPVGVSYVNVALNENALNIQNIFDEYPNLIEIKLYDAAGVEITGVTLETPATVVVCFNENSQPDYDILGRLRLLTEHNGQAKFLPLATLDPVLEQRGSDLCGGPLTGSAGFNSSAGIEGPQLGPNYAFGGVGGSAEEFSPFTIGDPGLEFGGVGGSAEEFSPGMLPSGPAAVTGYDPNVPLNKGTWFGQIGDVQTTALPGFTIRTALGDEVEGVVVTFTLEPTTAAYSPTSEAKLCDAGAVETSPGSGIWTVTKTTGTNGQAYLDCLDFGDALGYKNLHVTFDPTGLEVAGACMVSAENVLVKGFTRSDGTVVDSTFTAGECLPPVAWDYNFLIQTIEGAPAGLSVTPSSGAAGQAGGDFDFTVQVVDQNGNAIKTDPLDPRTPRNHLIVKVTGSSGDSLYGTPCTGTPVVCSATTGDDGKATFTDLNVGRRLGTATLKFEATGVTADYATVTINAPGAAKLLQVVDAPVAGRLDEAFSTMPRLRVTDLWGNPVLGADVGVTKVPAYSTSGTGNLVCVSGTTCDMTPETAEVQVSAAGVEPAVFDTLAVFKNLTITDLKLSNNIPQYLQFRSSGTTCGTAAGLGYCERSVSPTAGAPVFSKTSTGTPDFPNVTAYGTPVTAQVKVADKYGNPYSTTGNAITWVVEKTGFGSFVNPTSSDAVAGLSSTAWRLGDDGTNKLTATWNGTATGWTGTVTPATADFYATTAKAIELARACVLGNPTKKLDLGSFNGSTYTAWYTFEGTAGEELPNVIRSLHLWMSITGQSSSTAMYPARIDVYNSTNLGDPIATGVFGSSVDNGGTLGGVLLPGDNGTPVEVKFHLVPVKTRTTPTVAVKLQFQTDDASRTPQVWYNSKATGSDYCSRSVGYAAGTSPSAFGPRDQNKGIVNRISNWNKDY